MALRDGANSILTLKGVTLADLMLRISRTGGAFRFSHWSAHPGISYRDPAGNLIAVYEERGWNGEVWCTMYRACDPAHCYCNNARTGHPLHDVAERARIVALTKPRTLGGPQRIADACGTCGASHCDGRFLSERRGDVKPGE